MNVFNNIIGSSENVIYLNLENANLTDSELKSVASTIKFTEKDEEVNITIALAGEFFYLKYSTNNFDGGVNVLAAEVNLDKKITSSGKIITIKEMLIELDMLDYLMSIPQISKDDYYDTTSL